MIMFASIAKTHTAVFDAETSSCLECSMGLGCGHALHRPGGRYRRTWPRGEPEARGQRHDFQPWMLARVLAVLLILVLVSCAQKDVHLTFWVGGAPQEVDFLEALVQEFEARSGIDVEVIRQPTASNQRKQGLVMALESRQPDPDVFLMDIIWIPQFVQSGWLEPLDAYFRESSVQPRLFFPSVVERVDRYSGRYYALPDNLDVGVLYYREDLLRQYGFKGPPATWEELVRQALKIQAAERGRNAGFNGFIWQGAQYEGLVCTFLEFLSTFGGEISSDSSVELDSEPNRRALQFMQDLIHRYGISPLNTYTEMQEEPVRRSFQRGNALFERNWLYAWSLHQQPDSIVRGKVGLTALPHAPGAHTAATLGGWHLGISKTADAKAAAWQLVAFLLSRQTQKRLLMKLGWYSGRMDVYSDPEVQQHVANVKKLAAIVRHAVSRPELPYYDDISQVIQRDVNECLAGKRSARQALDAMQQEIQQIERLYGQK